MYIHINTFVEKLRLTKGQEKKIVKRKRNGYDTRRVEKSRAKGCYPNRFAESSFGIFNIQARGTSIYQVTIRKIVIIVMLQSILLIALHTNHHY